MERRSAACPLCGTPESEAFHRDASRPYLLCLTCDLVFVPRKFHPTSDEEKLRYELHENSPDDPEYRRFLSNLLAPLVGRLEPGSSGLDFGSGPGPALPRMLREMGFRMSEYDPFFADDRSVLERSYDFVTCTETVEHFSSPAREFELILGLVGQGGIVGIMTQMRQRSRDFAAWNYTRDETHVCFYSSKTFEWIADRFEARLNLCGSSVAILEKL